MFAITLLGVLAVCYQGSPQIELRGTSFVIKSGSSAFRVSLEPASAPEATTNSELMERIAFRKDDAYAVWDARGLVLRKGPRVRTTRLAEVALSPRALSPEEILRARLLMAAEAWSPWAAGVTGSRRIGDFVYFLARWVDLGGEPWLDALVRVNLADASLRTELLGRVLGRVQRPQGSDNSMLILNGRPAWVETREGGEWGVCSWTGDSSGFQWKRLGRNLRGVESCSGSLVSFTQYTSHGSVVLGRADLSGGVAKSLMETRGSVRLMDPALPWIAIVHDEQGTWLHNLESGAKLRIPEPSGFRRTEAGVLVWFPPDKPKSAALYNPDRFERLATWNAPSKDTRGNDRPVHFDAFPRLD